MSFSAQTRKETIKKLQENELDLLIIGGGITGAGLALQGGVRKMKTGLIEMQDFAAGTSSRSTKLVHGGLRYLKQFDVELVADVAQERAVIGKNIPHIVKPSHMLMPVYDEPGASFNEFSAEVVLHLYDYLAKVEDEWAHYFVDKEETLKEEPDLKEEGLLKGGFYLDYTNDDARLTTEILKKANEFGSLLANYVKAVGFIYDGESIVGVEAEDVLTGERFEIKATVVVNASGPWSDLIRGELNNEKEKKMFPTKGVHFVVDHDRLPVKRTIYTDTGLEDNRMIFIIPRGEKTYFGTTDTPFEGEYEEPEVTQEDIDYLLKAVNHRFPKAHITFEDIEASWAGLRPLIQDKDNNDPSGISRGHEIFVSDGGLVTIAGGKLTDYRRMANDTFETIDQELNTKGKTFNLVDTADIPLSGGDVPEETSFEEYVEQQVKAGVSLGLDEVDARYLANWYGSNVEKVFAFKEEAEKSELPLRIALQLEYALEYEMVISPVDFFARRTEILLFEAPKLDELKVPVVEELAKRFNWSEEEKQAHKEALEEKIAETTLRKFK
jgi:glycerol-3-phosphate dehydrogenase